MNPAQALADLLHGRLIGHEITPAEEAQAKAAGLVVVFGYSDDNVELRGAIDDEVAAWEGTVLRVCADGLLPDWDVDKFTDEATAETYFRRKAAGFKQIEALWCPDGMNLAWAYKTDIPHATFDVMEDGSVFSRGIVFALADVGAIGGAA